MGYIYLIEAIDENETKYKIGYTKNSATRRMKQLQTGTDAELKVVYEIATEYNQKLERALQRFHQHKNIKNEWFMLDLNDVIKFPELCAKIENNLTLIQKNQI